MKGYLSTEDCKYLLRALEQSAFSSIVSALRVQGPLSPYKHHLLDHLKHALFISEDRYHAELRRASNDDQLISVACKLNPSYEMYSDWAHAGHSVDEDVHMPVAVVPSSSPSQDPSLHLADSLLLLADQHNRLLDNDNHQLLQLLQLPKKPILPEVLRPLLTISEQHLDDALLVKSPAKTAHQQHASNRDLRSRSNSAASSSVPARSETPVSHTSDSAASKRSHSVKTERKSPKKSLIESEQSPIVSDTSQNSARMVKTRSKPRDNASCTCARVHPFLFEAAPPGSKLKPPRGNPDRRTSKRCSPSSASAFSSPTKHGLTGLPTTMRSVQLHAPSMSSAIGKMHHYVSAHGPTLVKRPRTTSAELSLLDSPSFPRQIAADAAARARQIARGYVRFVHPPIGTVPIPGSGTKFVVSSQAAASAAYSNPARPYYGNPSAAAMGITVRPSNDKGDAQLIVGHDYSSPVTTAPVLHPAVQISKITRRVPSAATLPATSSIRSAAPHSNHLSTIPSDTAISPLAAGASVDYSPNLTSTRTELDEEAVAEHHD